MECDLIWEFKKINTVKAGDAEWEEKKLRHGTKRLKKQGGGGCRKTQFEMSLGDNVHDLGLGKEVLGLLSLKVKIHKLDFIEIKNICTSNNTID